MRSGTTIALLLALLSLPAAAQPIPTRCAVETVPIDELSVDLRLIGCGNQYQDNILWHLDRADSVSGVLDGSALRPATGKGAVVYVYDSGIRVDHDEFVREDGTNVIGAVDPARELGLPTDPCASGVSTATDPCRDTTPIAFHWLYIHGTAVASVIAGRNTGVAPDANLVAVRALTISSSVQLEALDGIIRHAWDPATPPFRTAIVNMSTLEREGTALATEMEARMRDMIFGVDAEGRRDANGKRFLFVGIAGNYLDGPPAGSLYGHCDAERRVAMFPALRGTAMDGLIIVGGITPSNELWDRSCIGEGVDILAPASGMLVASLTARNHYRSGHLVFGSPANSGTSYAAPYVAGLAALLLEKDSNLSPEDLERLIKAKASHVEDNNELTGAGLVAIFDRPMGPRRRAVRR
jgi:subtilisin family serine protease